MYQIFLTFVIALVGIQSALASYCEDIEVPKCRERSTRDILFLVDGSNSMNQDRFYGELLNYTLAAFCAFDPLLPNKAGMILFNARVEVIIPLATYTQDEWYQRVWAVKNSRTTDTPACCSCCTPTGDAFVVAQTEFDARADPTHLQIAFILTDGTPSNNNPNTGGLPEWWFFDAVQGRDPALYAVEDVPGAATVLKDSGRRVILIGVPNALNRPPDQKYFDGRYPNGFNYCTTRVGTNFCGRYLVDPPVFPIVSLPVNQNSFSITNWEDTLIFDEIITALCFVSPTASPTRKPTTKAPVPTPTTKAPTSKSPTLPPTDLPTRLPTSKSPTSKSPTLAPVSSSPTSKSPTRLPTLSPSKPELEQIDLTFLVDRSRSITYTSSERLCQQVLSTFPEQAVQSDKPCWELWILYMTRQADSMSKIQSSTGRVMGWGSSFGESTPAKGLRVNVIGFACENNQRTPRLFDYTYESGPITSAEGFAQLMETLRTTVVPFGGTCPGLAIEQTIKNIEATNSLKYPLQTVILMTDGVFYDGQAAPRATMGLEAYNVLRYAVGITIAQNGNVFGMTPKEIETQRRQLTSFVGGDPQYFYNFANGWAGIFTITDTIAESLPSVYFSGSPPIRRFSWCGFRRKQNCAQNGFRMGNCKWTGSNNAEYKCRRK